MSRHRIQWLLACNLLSYFVCTFKNVTEGYIMQRMQIWVGLYSHYNASLPGYSYLSLFSISFLFCLGMATPYSYSYELGLECLLAVPSIAEPALAARDTALTIMTTSQEMLQVKPFGSKRCPFDLVCHLYIS